MSQSTTRRFTASASLAALGSKLRSRDLLDPIAQHLSIAQKTVSHSPLDKITDALIAILSGAHGLVEINTLLRSDPALQRAFGRSACAEQSAVQDTLNACTADNVKQLRFGCDLIFQQRSGAARHRFAQILLELDVDMSGIPCGRRAAFATKGYFGAHPKGTRGRQLVRVLAAQYQEIVADALFAGNTVLPGRCLRQMVQVAESALGLDETSRARTVLRIDAAGGSLEDVNWLLGRGYHVLCKDSSTARAEALAETVVEWSKDPRHPGRELGWVVCACGDYAREVRRLAGRCRRKDGTCAYAVIISTLLPHQARALAGCIPATAGRRSAELLAYAYAYDRRGGTIEIELKEDKQGLGIGNRQKKRFEAAQMVMLLNALAHNILVWSRRWLEHHAPERARLGLLRWVRDVLKVSGFLVHDATGRILRIVLNAASPLARSLRPALAALLLPEAIEINLGQT
jgi:hypothetical protein